MLVLVLFLEHYQMNSLYKGSGFHLQVSYSAQHSVLYKVDAQ